MTFEIRSDLPLPKRTGVGGRKPKYPFGELAVGQAFVVKSAEDPVKGASLRSSANGYSKKHPGWKFTVRAVEGGYGVWCIASPDAMAVETLAPESEEPDPEEDEIPDFEENEEGIEAA